MECCGVLIIASVMHIVRRRLVGRTFRIGCVGRFIEGKWTKYGGTSVSGQICVIIITLTQIG